MPNDAMVVLSLETLADVKGGLVAIMLEKALARMAQDIEVASDIKDWRTVTLEIRAKPVCEQHELSHVVTEFVVKGKVPSRVTSTSMFVRSNTNGARQLMFNIDAPDNPHQKTLLPVGDEEGSEEE